MQVFQAELFLFGPVEPVAIFEKPKDLPQFIAAEEKALRTLAVQRVQCLFGVGTGWK